MSSLSGRSSFLPAEGDVGSAERGHTMRFDIKVTGIDEVVRRLEELEHGVESISGEQEVPISELLSPDFLARHTEFASLEEMFLASGFTVETAEDFERIPDDEWDSFIRSHTQFSNWGEMLGAGSKEWAARKLGF